MKKLIAVMLACVLMLTLAAPALGETGYEILKGFLSQTGEDLCNLGQPLTAPTGDADNLIFLFYIQEEGTMLLSGVNARGEGEMCGWSNVELINAIAVFLNICTAWDAFSALCDSGYQVVLGWDYGEEDSLFIDTSEEAAMFAEAMENMINE